MSLTDKSTALVAAIRSFGTAVDDKTDNLGTGKQPLIPDSAITDFYAGNKTWRDLATDVRATPLTGVSFETDAAIAAEDTLLNALGKTQAQISRLSVSGVAPGTYRMVTVDASGRVMEGENPTTLAGYGITDALQSNGTVPLQNATMTTSSIGTTTTDPDQIVDSFSANDLCTSKYLIQAVSGTDRHAVEVILIHDGVNVFFTEYGAIFTTVKLVTLDADISMGMVRLLATPLNANTTITVVRTSINV